SSQYGLQARETGQYHGRSRVVPAGEAEPSAKLHEGPVPAVISLVERCSRNGPLILVVDREPQIGQVLQGADEQVVTFGGDFVARIVGKQRDMAEDPLPHLYPGVECAQVLPLSDILLRQAVNGPLNYCTPG